MNALPATATANAPSNALVWIYPTHTEAAAGIELLQRAGFDMATMSIVGKDYHTEEHVVGYYNAGDRVRAWGKLGAFWGGLWSLLFGPALFFVPTIGPLVMFGPLVGWLVGVLEGALTVGGLSALGAALFSIGIPRDSVLRYETAIRANQFLVMASGSPAQVTAAKALLADHGHEPDVADHHVLTTALATTTPRLALSHAT